MSTLLKAAIAYAARGWHVLPLRAASKLPATTHGLHDATTDAEVITGWWKRWPNANIGVRTGAVSGLVVLDVDPPHGFESLAELEAAHGALPPGPRVTTPRGGLHLYFAHPGGVVPNSAGKLGPGLDVRGDGGYVVTVPSVVGDKPYGGDLASTQLPRFALTRPSPPPRRDRPGPVLSVLPGGRYALAALTGEVNEVRRAPVGQRNHTLNLSAFRLGQLVGVGALEAHVAAQALLAAALNVGLGEAEARATILSGLNAGAESPRQGVGS